MTVSPSAEAVSSAIGALEDGLSRLHGLTQALHHVGWSGGTVDSDAIDALAYAFDDVVKDTRELWIRANALAWDATGRQRD